MNHFFFIRVRYSSYPKVAAEKTGRALRQGKDEMCEVKAMPLFFLDLPSFVSKVSSSRCVANKTGRGGKTKIAVVSVPSSSATAAASQ